MERAAELAAPVKIDPLARIEAVHLTVADLPRAVAFYTERIGFEVAGSDGAIARLGVGGPDLLILHGSPAAQRPRGTTGLFHFAILTPSRAALADAFARLVATRTPLEGAADHGVSEALYLADPEGNGIEIYRDRARSEWPVAGGRVHMVSDPVDLDALLATGRPDVRALEAGTTIGHIHLRVSDLAAAEHFYVGRMGFDLVARMSAAAFVSAGGYHHHIGFNTWGGVGIPAPPPGAAGLRHFVIRLASEAERRRLLDRVRAGGTAIEPMDGADGFADPSGNHITLAA